MYRQTFIQWGQAHIVLVVPVEFMEYETVIGLEVHVQLKTSSKMFCSCPADYQSAPPNSTVCPVCLGLPGALPVINRKAVDYTIMTGLALNCEIPEHTKFDRKNYPYPDLMKGYQISQYDLPLAVKGCLEIVVNGDQKSVGIERVHLEEDVAKLQHVSNEFGDNYSLVDVNRSGQALMEIVSMPDMRSPDEALAYLSSIHSIVQYLGVSTANMQDGSFRCDANVSVRPLGAQEFGTRTEVKNMNSYRAVFQALNYEVERQCNLLEQGDRVVQETRGWLEDRNITVSQRSKEYAHDYRYFPEPDLPPLIVDAKWVDRIKSLIPELGHNRKLRFMSEFALSDYDADLLTVSRDTADYFEEVLDLYSTAAVDITNVQKMVSNWILGDLTRLLNLSSLSIYESKVSPGKLVQLIKLIGTGSLNASLGKTVLEDCFESGDDPDNIVAAKGYVQINDLTVVEQAVSDVIDQNPKAVADYLSGNESAARFLMGQVMKLTQGQANPDLANQLILARLETKRVK